MHLLITIIIWYYHGCITHDHYHYPRMSFTAVVDEMCTDHYMCPCTMSDAWHTGGQDYRISLKRHHPGQMSPPKITHCTLTPLRHGLTPQKSYLFVGFELSLTASCIDLDIYICVLGTIIIPFHFNFTSIKLCPRALLHHQQIYYLKETLFHRGVQLFLQWSHVHFCLPTFQATPHSHYLTYSGKNSMIHILWTSAFNDIFWLSE